MYYNRGYKSFNDAYKEAMIKAQQKEEENIAKIGTVTTLQGEELGYNIIKTPIIEEAYYRTGRRSSNNGRLRDLPHIPDTADLFNQSAFGIVFSALFDGIL